MGRGHDTVRTHLKHVFAKLGVSRQLEVVRLVLALSRLPLSRDQGASAAVCRARGRAVTCGPRLADASRSEPRLSRSGAASCGALHRAGWNVTPANRLTSHGWER